MSPGDVATSRWMKVRANAGLTMQVDTMNAFSGTKALHITGTNLKGGTCATCSSIVISTKAGDPAFAGSPTTGYVRFMMFLKTFTESGDNHMRLVRIGNDSIDSLTNPTGYAFDLHFTKPAPFQFERLNDMYINNAKVDPVPLEGKWVCWEYQVAPGMMNWWQDGKVVTSSTSFTQTIPLSKMTVSVETYTPLPAIDLWFDDVAFDATKRIGCPAAK